MPTAASPSSAAPLIEREGDRIRLSGRLTLDVAPRLWAELRPLVETATSPLRLDLSGVTALDGGAAALLVQLARDAERDGRSLDLADATGSVAEILDMHRRLPHVGPLHAEPRPEGLIEHVGTVSLALARNVRGVLDATGRLTLQLLAVLRRPRSLNWRDLPALFESSGFDAVPIVALLSFLVGLVTAFQAAVQLEQFGANIFVADLVGLALTREMGPLMAAILVAGRSGAGIAADLGTMSVSEEIDALRTLGLSAYRHLVLPRVLALVLALPVLTLVADAMGILGGLVIGVVQLDISPHAFVNQLQMRLHVADVGTGLLKSVAFALVIAGVACERGLAARGGAAGVGRNTMSAVVTTLFYLVVVDALFGIVFVVWGV